MAVDRIPEKEDGVVGDWKQKENNGNKRKTMETKGKQWKQWKTMETMKTKKNKKQAR